MMPQDQSPEAAPSLAPVPAPGQAAGARQAGAARRRMTRDLAAALRDDGFVLQYQPRLSLATGAMLGAEALIRWRHPRQGLIPPSQFIPAAEQTGQITEIGGWVLAAACREASRWPGTTGVSVNVSARQLESGALARQIAHALMESDLLPERLEIELTETMLVEASLDTVLTLSAIRDLGVGIALDDFGTGFTSLSSLRRLPLTTLKLDRSMVRTLPEDREDGAILRAIIQAGHALGLQVVGEGIETEAQRGFLASAGCDEGQGFLFSRPLPAEQITGRLRGSASLATMFGL
jgi:EAL domain-containing protein (putative c-di-GMP-specific phosphodiesterase class I)